MRSRGSNNSSTNSFVMEEDLCIFSERKRVMRTPWIDQNSGRRYVACPNNACKDFASVDNPHVLKSSTNHSWAIEEAESDGKGCGCKEEKREKDIDLFGFVLSLFFVVVALCFDKV